MFIHTIQRGSLERGEAMSDSGTFQYKWDKTKRKCPICGKKFKPGSPNHRYCSKECREGKK